MKICPLCEQEIKKPKIVYGHTICKKCWAGYINRRQAAYLIDSFAIGVGMFAVALLAASMFGRDGIWLQFGANTLLYVYWLGRDGLNGRSLGKVAMNLETIDDFSGVAIGWRRAFLRNWPLAISSAIMVVSQFMQLVDAHDEAKDPLFGLAMGGFGVLLALLTVLILAAQMNKGPRWGDGLASTRVIWRRYAESPVFNPALASSVAAQPEFAPAIRSVADSTNDPYRAPQA